MSLANSFRNYASFADSQIQEHTSEYLDIDLDLDSEAGMTLVSIKKDAPVYFSLRMLAELSDCAATAEELARRDCRFRVLLSKRDSVFSLGGDLGFFQDCIKNGDSSSLESYANLAIDAIWGSITGGKDPRKISVALVQGEAQGGGFEAALASHLLIAERGAAFGFPEALFGLFPGMGAKPLLTARTNAAAANMIIGSARRFLAEELFDLGVVDFIAEPGHGMQMVRALNRTHAWQKFYESRRRFEGIQKEDLLDTTRQWVHQAMHLSEKSVKAIGYLRQAQVRMQRRNPIARVL